MRHAIESLWHSRSNMLSAARSLYGNGGLLVLLLFTLLVGLLGLTIHPRLLLLLAALLVVLTLGTVWPWLTVLLVRGRLHFKEDRIHERQEIQAFLSVRNRSPWPAWGTMLKIDSSPPETLPILQSFAATQTALKLKPCQRGIFPSRAPRLQTGLPFGLLTASRKLKIERPLIVWPQILPVATSPHWSSANTTVGHADTQRVGMDGDTIGTREYRRGDPMRWIHWSHTARHDRFMVREFQANGMPHLCILLDCDPDNHVGHGPDSSFEWAVRIAASLANGWLAQGAMVQLQAGNTALPAASGTHQLTRILDILAEIQLNRPEQPIDLATHNSSTVIITTDRGWNVRPVSAHHSSSGYILRSNGFGGDSEPLLLNHSEVIAIERPQDVPAALMQAKRGLADVA